MTPVYALLYSGSSSRWGGAACTERISGKREDESNRLPTRKTNHVGKENPDSKVTAIRAILAEHLIASPGTVAEPLTTQVVPGLPVLVSTVRTMMESPRFFEPQMPPMHLPFGEGKQFYKLYAALCSYANNRRKVVPGEFSDPEQFITLPSEIRWKVRDELYAHLELIDQFVQENPAQLTGEELGIVAGWKHAVIGDFYILRYLKQYALFLTDKTPPKAYGVLALASPFQEIVGPYLPALVQGVLLPINGRIIYDGLLASYPISFGAGIRRSLNENFQAAKFSFGIITSLPEGSKPSPGKKKATRKKSATSGATADVKAGMEAIVGMTDAFCRDYLNDECAKMCRNLAAALARKHPSSLLRGRMETWACGIVRTIGWVNFLDDTSRKPHLKFPLVDRAFGVAESTGQGKSKTIRRLLKIHSFEPQWTLPSRLDRNPRVWLVSVNGILMDMRNAPRELQVEAFEKGLIPYIAADRNRESEEDQ